MISIYGSPGAILVDDLSPADKFKDGSKGSSCHVHVLYSPVVKSMYILLVLVKNVLQ